MNPPYPVGTDVEANRNEVGDVIGADEKKGRGVLGGVATRTNTTSSWKDPGAPPDGGWEAWLQGEQFSSKMRFVEFFSNGFEIPWYSCGRGNGPYRNRSSHSYKT
jgi:hypothetical protein